MSIIYNKKDRLEKLIKESGISKRFEENDSDNIFYKETENLFFYLDCIICAIQILKD